MADKLRKLAFCDNQPVEKAKQKLRMNYLETDQGKSNIKTMKSKKISKNKLPLVDPFIVFKWEQYIFNFICVIYKNEDIYNTFKAYIDFVQDYDFELFLNHLKSDSEKKYYTQALILERICLMSFFYFCINNIFEKELLFIKKIINIVYANTCIYVTSFIEYLEKNQNAIFHSNKFKEILCVYTKRKLSDYNINFRNSINENNKLLWKYITVEIKLLEPHILDSIVKLKLFIDTITLNEAMSYLITLFSDIVK